MSQWSSTSESGILRKNKPKENPLELLVFGYACKLFRDDEKALYIDQGKHLIPWMGDDNLKIDRYDCRGALSDLRVYEASREGFDTMRWLGLNESERKLEELCDKERYYALQINEEEEEMYKEEEQKRQKTNAFQYSYDVPMAPETTQEPIPTVPEADEEEEYKPLPELDVPVDIEIPKTVKENARIEKTALFVSKQGLQMEILLKAKQGDNPQFSFLNQGDPLNKYYKHVLNAFKNSRYKGQDANKIDEKQDQSVDQDQDASGHYLHPSLLSANSQPASQSYTSTIPAIPYKPSPNCAYSQLVNRIQGNQSETTAAETAQKPVAVEVPSSFTQLTYEQQQYCQYYYTSQYYEYYKQLAQYQQSCAQGENPGQMVQLPNFQLEPSLQHYLQHVAYTQYVQQHHQQQQQQQQKPPTNNSYAQIVSNVNRDGSNPYAANLPSLPPNLSAAAVTEKPKSEVAEKTEVKKSVVVVKKPLLSLAQYGSDSENEEEADEPVEEQRRIFKVPTGEKQNVIDKMALYVSKNGDQFEEIVKAKGDPRLDFLKDDHEFHEYYREKVKEYKNNREGNEKTKSPSPEREVVIVPPKPKEKKIIAPVSFSIKKTKEEQPKEIKSALPIEESDEEEVLENASNNVPSAVVLVANISNSNKSTDDVCTSENTEDPKDEDDNPKEEDAKNGIILDSDDPILEMIDLTDDTEERKDAKRAEDRIKDKIAAAAREKLAASVNRDKALQLERKKKLAAFLKLKNVDSTTQSSNETFVPEETSDKSKKENVSKGVQGERKSRERNKSIEREKKSKERSGEKRSPKRDVVHIDSDSDENDAKKSKRSSKKKKAHKRKHSRSKHEKSKKKSKKRSRKRSTSNGSGTSSSNS